MTLGLAAVIHLAACSEAVMMSHESDHAGVVTYLYKTDRGGPMGSPYRREAMDRINAKCPAGSQIVREGQARGYSRAGMGVIEGTEDEERGMRWGIQFECKPKDRAVSRQDIGGDGKGLPK